MRRRNLAGLILLLLILPPRVAMAQRAIGPFQVAADIAYRALQVFEMKEGGAAEEAVRNGLVKTSGVEEQTDLLSMLIATSLPNFIEKIYAPTAVEPRKMTHELLDSVLFLTRKKYGNPKSAVEIRFSKCLKAHAEGYQFALSLENQLKSKLNNNYSSVYPGAHKEYIDAYFSGLEQTATINSVSIMERYASCFKSISVS